MGSVNDNKTRWNRKFKQFLDNNNEGEHWSISWGNPLIQWYSTIYPRICDYLPSDSILEIGAGLGRWSTFLKYYTDELILNDISDVSIKHLKNKFDGKSNVKIIKGDGYKINDVHKNSIGFVFSFDSLVHCEIDVIKSYLESIHDILTMNGHGFIHHSNLNACSSDLKFKRENSWRGATVSATALQEHLRDSTLSLIQQELIDWSNSIELIDCFSVIKKQVEKSNPTEMHYNNLFMKNSTKIKKSAFLLNHLYKTIFNFRRFHVISEISEKNIITQINSRFVYK